MKDVRFTRAFLDKLKSFLSH